ncbi:hypothetical protein [Acinetobacter sp.]|uniref:hypothetical protein n=1 Tax=Acinetobacter sp. TaxID=472 RepID=UPI0035B4205C
MKTFFNTFKRLLGQQEQNEPQQEDYSDNQLITWAVGCMLEGLADDFFEAKMLCSHGLSADEQGRRTVQISYLVKLEAESADEQFEPADYLYPIQCIETILKGKEWSEASIHFTPQSARFAWA